MAGWRNSTGMKLIVGGSLSCWLPKDVLINCTSFSRFRYGIRIGYKYISYTLYLILVILSLLFYFVFEVSIKHSLLKHYLATGSLTVKTSWILSIECMRKMGYQGLRLLTSSTNFLTKVSNFFYVVFEVTNFSWQNHWVFGKQLFDG